MSVYKNGLSYYLKLKSIIISNINENNLLQNFNFDYARLSLKIMRFEIYNLNDME